MTTFEQRVDNYLKAERQWTRQCRIDHARLLLSKSKAELIPFYKAVLTKLGAPDAQETPHEGICCQVVALYHE